MSKLTGIFAALGSTGSWALCAILFKKLGEKLEPIGMTTVKAIFSVIFLLIFMFVARISFQVDYNIMLKLALSGIIGVAIGDSLFFASLARLSPLVLSIILFVGPDLFTGILGLLVLGENPPIKVWVGILLVLSGLAFLIFPLKVSKDYEVHKTTVIGIILALLSLLCTSTSTVIIKPVLSEVSSITATMYRMLFGGAFLLTYGMLSKKITVWKQPFIKGEYRWGFIGTVFIVTFGGFWLSLLAIKNCDIVVVSTLMTLEPLFILLFMLIFNKYRPKMGEYWGIFLSIIGIFIILLYSS